MTGSAVVAQNDFKKGIWWAFPFHQILSTVGILAFAGIVSFILLPTSRARWILTEVPYFPIQTSLAFCIGVFLPRFLRHRFMEWTWVLPFFVLCVCILLTPLTFAGRFERYFSWGCRPEARCFVQLAVTLPFYTATSYSLAAFLSRKARKRHKQQHEIGK